MSHKSQLLDSQKEKKYYSSYHVWHNITLDNYDVQYLHAKINFSIFAFNVINFFPLHNVQ